MYLSDRKDSPAASLEKIPPKEYINKIMCKTIYFFKTPRNDVFLFFTNGFFPPDKKTYRQIYR